VVRRADDLGAADEAEQHPRPGGVVELQRHAGDDKQKEPRDYEKVQKALEGNEAHEPLTPFRELIFAARNRFESVQ